MALPLLDLPGPRALEAANLPVRAGSAGVLAHSFADLTGKNAAVASRQGQSHLWEDEE